MADLAGPEDLAQILRKMVGGKHSGTILINTHDGHVATMVFDAGKLAAVTHGGFRGPKAIPLILEFNGGTGRMVEVANNHAQTGLPSATNVITWLMEKASQAPTLESVQQQGQGAAQLGPDSTGETFYVARTFERIGEIMIDYIGPIGPALCRNAAEKLGHNASYDATWNAVVGMASDIADPNDHEQFLQLAKEILQDYSE
jgi:hypothetical protein